MDENNIQAWNCGIISWNQVRNKAFIMRNLTG